MSPYKGYRLVYVVDLFKRPSYRIEKKKWFFWYKPLGNYEFASEESAEYMINYLERKRGRVAKTYEEKS